MSAPPQTISASMRATTPDAADPRATGGSSTGTPPAASTAAAYSVGSRSARAFQTPHAATSRYVVSPTTGASSTAASERGDVGTRDAAVDEERGGRHEARLV